MKDMMQHKGYFGSIHYSDEDSLFFGKIEFIRSLISFEAESVKTLKDAFYQAIEDYLSLCSKAGKEPEKPFKGTFNVRVDQNLHREAALYAGSHQISLNCLINRALQTYLKSEHHIHS